MIHVLLIIVCCMQFLCNAMEEDPIEKLKAAAEQLSAVNLKARQLLIKDPEQYFDSPRFDSPRFDGIREEEGERNVLRQVHALYYELKAITTDDEPKESEPQKIEKPTKKRCWLRKRSKSDAYKTKAGIAKEKKPHEL